MLRMRRSRIILVLAVFTLFLLFHFKSIPDRWSTGGSRVSVGSTPAKENQQAPVAPQSPPNYPPPEQQQQQQQQQKEAEPPEEVGQQKGAGQQQEAAGQQQKEEVKQPAAVNTQATTKPTAPAAPAAPAEDHGLVFDTHEAPKAPKPTKPAQAAPPAQTVAGTAAGGPDKFGLMGTKTTTSTSSQIHWTKLPEHFPVPLESIIPLPTGKEKAIPKVQHAFKDEAPLEKAEREKKQARIKAAFKKSWDGYTQFAWLHDELSPVSGQNRDPFCGWAATLVDSLDSLLIMGMENEFLHALEGLAKIDFTTTTRREIPLFETTIRYMGGLLAAHDLDGGKHRILLDKAVELAEVLMGAFDTPNRMPQTFYQWMPIFAEQPMRARTRVVMAELGSLSMEFTRLSQITGDNKYYDAIARITNEFEAWQDKTKIPGLWPLFVDASGCKKPEMPHVSDWKQKLMNNDHDLWDARDVDYANRTVTTTIVAVPQLAKKPKATTAPDTAFDHENNIGKIQNWGAPAVNKRQLGEVPPSGGNDNTPKGEVIEPVGSTVSVAAGDEIKVDCEPQGLASPPGSLSEDFAFGGLADSTYEYLPKEYLLLGGQVAQYQEMYEKVITAANKYLLYRPMTPNEDDILVLGNGKATGDVSKPGNLHLSPDHSHLLCFAGGMYALGSKIFNRPQDLEIGRKMTDSCVWAYGITDSGIMPEDFKLLQCDSLDHCPWNQTRWEYLMDPYPEDRISDGLIMPQVDQLQNRKAQPKPTPSPVPTPPAQAEAAENSQKQDTDAANRGLGKRQLGNVENDENYVGRAANRMHYIHTKAAPDGSVMGKVPGEVTPTLNEGDQKPMSQKEYVEFITEQRRLPVGVPQIASRKYILRPEAIESVFYMYRLTGDPVWREKGWRMFEAIETSTDTKYGASAILDVMDERSNTVKLDEMESFWLAETLKYFYLLFSTEDTISLDDYVLNTEAHPFKRPGAARG